MLFWLVENVVLFASGPESVRAAVQATRTIPIVGFDLETNPVEAGYVASFRDRRTRSSATPAFRGGAQFRRWLQREPRRRRLG